MIEKTILYKETIFKAFLTGAKAVIKEEDYLNEINVFPIKDADTGSNMTSLMNSIIDNAQIKSTLKETMQSISDSALIGSKGNSGLIFSQFIYGLSKDINIEYIYIDKLIEQIEKGYKYAYESIDQPEPGTMITLMYSWYELLISDKNNYNSFEEYLVKTNEKLKEALNNTKNQLKVLKENDVVDSGALAFTLFVDGFINSVINDEYKIDFSNSKITEIKQIKHNYEDYLIKYIYCTEILIETKLDKNAIKDKIYQFGDSLVIGKSNKYYKIHIHTNKPEDLLTTINSFSKVINTKIDNMENQYEIKHNRKHEICILTDSIADISYSIIKEKQIQVFPVNINVNGTIYFDKLTIKNDQLLDLIRTESDFPKSSSPSTISVTKTLEYLKKYYKKIIVITVSSKMSSTYNIFKKASEKLETKDIVIIDSKQNSVSQGLIVLNALNAIESNQTFEEVIKLTNHAINNSNILVNVASLDNMIKGGRITKGLGLIAKIIKLRPIVSINRLGEGIVISKTIGKKQSMKKILKHLKKVHKKYQIKAYAISHVGNLKDAEALKTKIINTLGIIPQYITETSSVIAMNAGSKAVAVGYIKGERKWTFYIHI